MLPILVYTKYYSTQWYLVYEAVSGDIRLWFAALKTTGTAGSWGLGLPALDTGGSRGHGGGRRRRRRRLGQTLVIYSCRINGGVDSHEQYLHTMKVHTSYRVYYTSKRSQNLFKSWWLLDSVDLILPQLNLCSQNHPPSPLPPSPFSSSTLSPSSPAVSPSSPTQQSSRTRGVRWGDGFVCPTLPR